VIRSEVMPPPDSIQPDGSVLGHPQTRSNSLSLRRTGLMCLALFASFALSPLWAEDLLPPTLEQRIADLEAYIKNEARTEGVASHVYAPGPGHNAWLMTSSALVLFMTLPGLCLFYGGLVRRKNVLSVLAQCLGITGMVTLLWWVCGYSLSFSAGNSFVGGFEHAFFRGVDSSPGGGEWISHNVFAMFQLMFAIITPALIVGAVAERMKYSALLLFIAIWMLVVYFPLAHMVWGGDGLMNGLGNDSALIRSIDFAGGTVVHMSSGWTALVLCIVLGKRQGFGKEPMPPHSMVLCMVGTGMLWVGWYGFNAGSALGADGIAASAFTNTTLAAAIAGFVWGMTEYVVKGKPSVLGYCSGIVAGLVVVTPAAGFVSSTGAVWIGIAAGLVPFLACYKLKAWLGYDDSLDTFGIHGVGGTLGALLTGILANPEANSALLSLAGATLWWEQTKAILATLVLVTIATLVIAYAVSALIGLRVDQEVETIGLDLSEHGEEGYHGA
jgi:ammonium transporter, Amt family